MAPVDVVAVHAVEAGDHVHLPEGAENEDRAGADVLFLYERIHIAEEILARFELQVKNPAQSALGDFHRYPGARPTRFTIGPQN